MKTITTQFLLGCAVIILMSASLPAEPYKVGFATWIGYGPLYLAEEKGFFSDLGIEIELIRMEGTAEKRSALLAHRIDALGSTIDDYAVSVTEGVRGKVPLLIDESFGADGILAKKGISDIRDLIGKKVGVQPGFANHFLLLSLLDRRGIAPNEINVVPMDPDQAVTALVTGDVDAAVTWEPHLSAIQKKGGYNLLASTRDSDAQHLIVDTLVVSDRSIATRRQDTVKVLQAWFRALAFLQAHPTEAYDLMAKHFQLTSADVAGMLQGVRFLSTKDNQELMDRDHRPNVRDVASNALRLYSKAGVLPPDTNADILDDWLALDLLDEAIGKH